MCYDFFMARPRMFDEKTVLKAARDAFWQSGYGATSMDDLMRATGLGKGSLYAAFGGKRELFERVFRAHCSEAVRDTAAKLEGPDEGAYERLCTYVLEPTGETVWSDGALGCLIAKTGAELAGSDTVIKEQTRAAYEALDDALAACIAAAQRNGDIAASANPRDISALLLATLRGIEALGKGGMPAGSLQRAARAALDALPTVANKK
jgi:TetR/AcrR family transcriptional repressor of nem operon